MSHANDTEVEDPKLPVSEVFHSFQGEGPSLGTPATFVRLMGCNLTCTFCDTPYTWKPGHLDTPKRLTVSQIIEPVRRPHHILVITGGEPSLHFKNPAMWELIQTASIRYAGIEIETNGTSAPNTWPEPMQRALRSLHAPVVFNVSPKRSNSITGDEAIPAVDYRSWIEAPPMLVFSRFKFVIGSVPDYHDVLLVMQTYKINPSKVWLMPKGTTSLELKESHVALSGIADDAASQGIRMTTRLHTLMFEARRGV